MEPGVTATATPNQSEAAAPVVEAPATLLTAVDGGAGKQTSNAETQTPPAPEKPAAETPKETPATEKPAVEKPAQVAPEKYEFKAPEGMQFNPAVLDAYSGVAKKANLSQEVAQELIDTVTPAIAAAQVEQMKAIHSEWSEASKTDQEIGGEKFKEHMGVARKALDTFGTPELRTLLDTTGFGNHPEVLRLLYRAGKAISEDSFIRGPVAVNASPQTLAEKLYGPNKT